MIILRKRQHGLSLVELLIGMAIGLVLTLGIFSALAASSQAFKVQDDFARIQENGTSALRYIGDSIRHAGFYGYLTEAGNIVNRSVAMSGTECGATGLNDPASGWAIAVAPPAGGPIVGFWGLTQLDIANYFPCISPSNFQAGPVLGLRLALPFRIPDPNNDGNLTDGLTAQTNSSSTVYVQSDPNVGNMFYGTDYAALRSAGDSRFKPDGRDVDIFQYTAQVYYIRPCSRQANGATCATTDDGGFPIPTLVRQELVGSAMVEVPLVEGIERMSLRYGIDTDGNGVPETFTDEPAVGNFQNVVAVRVSFLVRSPLPSTEYQDNGKRYDLDGDGTIDYQCTTFLATNPRACSYKRKVFSQVFQLRNIAQRRGA